MGGSSCSSYTKHCRNWAEGADVVGIVFIAGEYSCTCDSHCVIARAGPVAKANDRKMAGCMEYLLQIPIGDPEEIRNLTTPPPYIYDGWKDWETWKAGSDVVQAFPYSKMGCDLDGVPVYLVEFGKWDYRKWALKPEDKLEEFWRYFEQFVRRQEKDAKANNGQGMVQLVDWDDFSLSHHASPNAIKLAMRMFSLQLRMDHGLKYGLYVNVNYAAETFINAMRPFMGSMLDKYEVCGTRMAKCKPMLMKKIGSDQLPPKYGGTNKEWKPVPFN